MSDAEAPMSAAQAQAVTDEEWRSRLSPFEYNVLRQKGTEPRGGEYDKFYPAAGEGFFACRACHAPLYSAAAKFSSGCGWPAFDKCYKGSVNTFTDSSHGMQRIEITCATCGGHLGHVFQGERMTATNERHCVNSVSVKFVKNAAPPSAVEEPVLKK
jgi:peptide-methionine (R)-S-oxide reductase